MKVVIVGGVAGGASAAARLRRLDESAEIVLLERGSYISFANCGLPYYIGGEIKDEQALTVQTPKSFSARFNVDVRIRNEALSIDPAAKTVRVKRLESNEDYTLAYDKLLLAPGAEPIRPPLPGIDDPRIFTLRTIPDTLRIHGFLKQKSPKTAVVVGGGFIGLEMAENLARKGLSVSIVEMADHLLAPLDRDMAYVLHRYLRKKGVSLYLGSAVQGFLPGEEHLVVQTPQGDISTDMVLLGIGVRPESGLARQAGLAVGKRGGIVVDEQMRTGNPDIYAVGDAVEITNFVSGQKGQVPLAGPANKQGRIAADNICGIPSRYKGTQGSAIVRAFGMTVAATGLNERAAAEAGIAFHKVYTQPLSHAGYYPGAEYMNFKLLFEKETGRVLGAQMVGFDGVDKRCDVVAAAIRANMTVSDLTELELCYAPPYSSAKDPVNMAGYAAENILHGLVKQYYWEDLQKLPRDGSVTLLDVRTPAEHAQGSVEGFVNIPLDELRGRLQTLDKSKPVYVHCLSGMRSYVAARILAQNGFDSYNFAGGYDLFDILQSDKR